MTFKIAQQIYDLLQERKQSLAVAESLTGGALAEAITQVPGSSKVFLGGIVAYQQIIKQSVLHIPQDVIERYSAESAMVAEAMAHNVKAIFNSSWAISTTGFSGPSGGNSSPIGSVWIGVLGPFRGVKAQVFSFCFKNLSRLEHRQKTVSTALKILLEMLEKNDQ